MSEKRVIASGMRPTGTLHLGNLVGALDNWVKLQGEYRCFFFIVDWHALTTPGGKGAVGFENVDVLQNNITQMAIDWVSAGLDPDKSVIFVQSHVKEVAELHLLLSMITPLGWLERNPTYRIMVEDYGIESPSYGLLGYPTLQAADILAYKGEYVPVGRDQASHVNLSRDIAGRFNNLYGREVFPIPEALFTEVPKVPGLDDINKKMSKSAGNYIALADSDETTTEKVKNMFTDPLKAKKNDKGHPDGCVVYAFHNIFNKDELSSVRDECEAGLRGCMDCKLSLASKMNSALRGIRGKRRELESKPDRIKEILLQGAKEARAAASSTLGEVREAMKVA